MTTGEPSRFRTSKCKSARNSARYCVTRTCNWWHRSAIRRILYAARSSFRLAPHPIRSVRATSSSSGTCRRRKGLSRYSCISTPTMWAVPPVRSSYRPSRSQSRKCKTVRVCLTRGLRWLKSIMFEWRTTTSSSYLSRWIWISDRGQHTIRPCVKMRRLQPRMQAYSTINSILVGLIKRTRPWLCTSKNLMLKFRIGRRLKPTEIWPMLRKRWIKMSL